MSQATGKNRFAKIETTLGTDALLLERVSGSEELGRLFDYQVDLLSERIGIKAEDLLGSNVTMSFETPEASAPRYINGFVTRFAAQGEVRTAAFNSGIGYRYHIEVRPWVWFATRRSDCRIFNNKTVIDIIQEVLPTYGFTVEVKSSKTYKPWKYCVQYRETDFNFVSRLMEQEGIYYFFEHKNGGHQLALADSMSAHVPHPKFGSFRFGPSTQHASIEYDYLSEWSATSSVQPGKFLHRDYDFFKARSVEGVAEKPRGHTFGDIEVYDYPSEGLDTSGDDKIEDRTSDYASIRMEEFQSQYRILRGAGNMRGLEVGRRFKLTEHPNKENNAEYLVVSTDLSASVNDYASGSGGGGADFQVSFTAIKSDQTFRPQRLTPKPVVQGAQTAIVVGSGEIDPDKFGRVKIQFHWDRLGRTCWARVAQTIAGKGWGAMFIPRVGHEVIVEFLEGDPDHPIITGVVYSGVAVPPYALPDEKTKSTIKTNSSTGGGGFNEIRFEDKKGKEQIFLHGQNNLDVRILNDRLTWIGRDTHLITKRDRLEKIERDQHLDLKGDLNEKITGIHSLKIDQKLQYKVGMNAALDSGMEIHLKAGMKLILEAGVQLSLKVGGNFIDINPAGVFISGTMVFINSGGSAGSGSGSSPAAPKEAQQADDGKPGQTDAAPPAPKPPKAQTHSPKAVALKEAAQSGAPFCDV